jgi:hypothetical protein
MPRRPDKDIAALLQRIADLLQAKNENQFRVRSYRVAAQSILDTKPAIVKLIQAKGPDGLAGIKGVGEKIAGLIVEYVQTGKAELLESLIKEVPAERVKEVKHEVGKPIGIPVDLILRIDGEYRTKAAAGRLKLIAPKKLNPTGKAWLPILAKEEEGYKFTVMFSNTATAHELGKTNDWVVVYYEKGKGENQCTVVTESRGQLKGKRVVRGREKECEKYYAE